MREKLCSSDSNWGEGYAFLSGHGLNLRMQDNCTTDNDPLGIDLVMTISSTVKNRTDCWYRTESIIKRCVINGYPDFNGGEWYDTDGADDPSKDAGNGKTFIYMQYLHIDPPPEPNPCYEYPPPPYCTPYSEASLVNRGATKMQQRRNVRLKGTVVDLDLEGNVIEKRFIHDDGTVELLA